MIDGSAIRKAREAAGLRQEDIAQALDVTEVTIWRWESGRTRRLDYGTALRLADALGVEVGDLMSHAPEADSASTGCGTNNPHRSAEVDVAVTSSAAGASRER